MTTLDLAPADLRLVLQILARHAPGAEVWAYGSRVAGGAHEGSDLDLVVRQSPNPEGGSIGIGALQAAFAESSLPIAVDVLDWAHLPEAFRRQAAKSHVVLQPSPVGPDAARPYTS